jgi:hypothetical protein
VMIGVLQGAAAPDGNKPGVSILGEDHTVRCPLAGETIGRPPVFSIAQLCH